MKDFIFVLFVLLFVGSLCSSSLPVKGKVDLWIVGSGTLGTLIAKEWKERNPESIIITETLTSQRHPLLLSLGTIPRQRAHRFPSFLSHPPLFSLTPSLILTLSLTCSLSLRHEFPSSSCAKNVIVCIPPSHQSTDKDSYLEEIRNSFDLYDNSNHLEKSKEKKRKEEKEKGMYVLISSTAVYGDRNETINEFSSIERRYEINPRAARSPIILPQ